MKAYFEAQGSLLHMKIKGRQAMPPSHDHKRGIVLVFSRASRRRLMRFLARLKTRKIRASFLTLTFTEIVTNERAKLVFKRFTAYLRRHMPQASAVWRMEFQDRGAIHFHLLCFNLPFWKQAEIQRTWERCTQELCSIVHIKLVHGARSIMSYISKYIAKPDERSEITSLEDVSYQHASAGGLAGRFWGWINKELLPLGQKYEGVLTDDYTIKSISIWAWKLTGIENTYNSLTFHLFADNAEWFWSMFIERGGMDMDEWRWSRYLTVSEERQARYVDLEWNF
jgi:hypothetical protein